MTVTHHTTVVTDGLALPLYDLRQPKLQALLATYMTQIQQLEDALWALYIGLMIEQAVGDALDMLGALVGQPRENRPDPEYRLWIRSRVIVNKSSGRPLDILGVARAVLPPLVNVANLHEAYPASFVLTLEGIADTTATVALAALLRIAKAAGVALSVEFSIVDPLLEFTVGDAAAAPESSTTQGFASTDQLTGGQMASAA